VVCESHGLLRQERRERDGSFVNDLEAQAVVGLIDVCLNYGVEPFRIGCVALYRAQSLHIATLLGKSG
jgi:superfamily I DNA and/or RNA helicase